MSDIEVSTTIAADADTLWRMISDLPRMGEWSPENAGGRWVGGANGAEVGAKFRGTNRAGWRRWSTTVTVTEAEPGRRFAFDVSSGPVPVSAWAYTFEPAGESTRVTESWSDRRPGWMQIVSKPVTGVNDRAAHNKAGMEQTLARLKAAAESGG